MGLITAAGRAALAFAAASLLQAQPGQAAPWRTYHSDLGPDQQRQHHQLDLGSLVRQGDRVSGMARIRRTEGFSTLASGSYRFVVGCRAGTIEEQLIPGALTYQRRGGEWWSEAERRRGIRSDGGGALGGDSSRLRAIDAQFTALWRVACEAPVTTRDLPR